MSCPPPPLPPSFHCSIAALLFFDGSIEQKTIALKMVATRGGYPGGIFWVRGRAIGKGIDFHDFGIKNGINFRNLHNWYSVGCAFSENWYKVGYIFLKNWYKVGYTFRKNWYKERVCF